MTQSENQTLAEPPVSILDRFRAFHRLALADHQTYRALYANYLTTGLRIFDLKVGIVSRIDQERYTVLAVEPKNVGIAAGDVMQLGQTYCALVLRHQSTIAVSRAGSSENFSSHPAYLAQGLESYLAAPIWVNDALYGTLNFTAPSARQIPFDEVDIEVIELMARSIGQIIERDQIERARLDAVERMRENTELFESAFEYATIGMALVGTDGRWLRVNLALTEILGYPEEELLSIDFQTITHPDDLDTDLEFLQEMLDGQRDSYRMEKRYFHKKGHEIWILLSVSLVRYENATPRYFVSQIQDITERKHSEAQLARKQRELELANRKLQELSTVDPLTGVMNRRAFNMRLDQEIKRASRSGLPISFLLIDVDHFKRFNDDHGHQAGDQALSEVGAALMANRRVNDAVARYGGEEFAMILPQTDAQGCAVVAERVKEAVASIDGLACPITVSIGTATFEPARSVREPPAGDSLIEVADKALYAAKAEGRNRVAVGCTLQGGAINNGGQ
ncbi:sensor domain-containing diguanylate cyclase [Salinisphaera sp. LB1]|uniref:sensor domain-containing diguanylate cyclase n=1 Tax=Salinisphaera sp. LB1 TaxID=2183911 RepID=UPI000D705CA2|nr:sensor domain-containing diguanylate cyclase [Salinisphaera sp. LB1]AWN16467.1 putative two-component response regulator with GGDEF domain [Salinisphaera sp. LB1]